MYTVTDADTVAVQKTGLVLASTLLFLCWAREDFKSLASGSWWSFIIIVTHTLLQMQPKLNLLLPDSRISLGFVTRGSQQHLGLS